MSLPSALLYVFGAGALLGALLMLLARHPMRVALALIGVMLSLAGIYAALGVHVVAVFQVLIYVGAVMVFMVYVIMLLDLRDPSFLDRYGRLLLPGVLLGTGFVAAVAAAVAKFGGLSLAGTVRPAPSYLVQPFSAEFVQRYWLQFELTSVLLVAAVVAAIAVIRSGRGSHG